MNNDLVSQLFNVYLVPLHRHESNGRTGSWVRRPIIKPGDLRFRFGEEKGRIFVIGGPAETTFEGRHDRRWVGFTGEK